jgi:hypothetical protein
MAKWPTPHHLERKLASGSERRAMTRLQLGMRTCPTCGGVFREPADSRACEAWHKKFWDQMRRDLTDAINRLDRDIPRASENDRRAMQDQRKRMVKQRDKLPRG